MGERLERLFMIVRGNLYRMLGINKRLYQKRYVYCAVCPASSRNTKDLTDSQWLWSLGGDFCTECTCPLKSKLVEPLSECPQLKWGQELKTKNQ